MISVAAEVEELGRRGRRGSRENLKASRDITTTSSGRSGSVREGSRENLSGRDITTATISSGRSGSGRRGSRSGDTTNISSRSGWSHFARTQGSSTSVATFLALGYTDCHTHDNRHSYEQYDDYDRQSLGCAIPWCGF